MEPKDDGAGELGHEQEGAVSADDYERLADAFDRVAQSLDEVRTEFTSYRDTARLRAALGGFVLIVMLIVMAGGLLVSKSNAEVVAAIKDCTEPGGQCYEANAKRSDQRLGPFRVMICDATPPERRGIYCPK
jgi:hypothetical protein